MNVGGGEAVPTSAKVLVRARQQLAQHALGDVDCEGCRAKRCRVWAAAWSTLVAAGAAVDVSDGTFSTG